MKKIMFNDRYGLTEAVLQGRKTVTRRIMSPQPSRCDVCKPDNSGRCIDMDCQDYPIPITKKPPYKVGEIVAVAQSYKDAYNPPLLDENGNHYVMGNMRKGWNDKRCVCADLMTHQIRIIDVRAERLQDITGEDCLREGVRKFTPNFPADFPIHPTCFEVGEILGDTAREAFSALIDKISGKGTWELNPYVWRIEFELSK